MSQILLNSLSLFTASVIWFLLLVGKRKKTESMGDYRFRAVMAAIGIMFITILMSFGIDKVSGPIVNFPHPANPGAAGAAP